MIQGQKETVVEDKIALANYRFTLTVREPIRLPRMNKGITLRGAFGSSFRALVCVDRTRQCGGCALHPTCPYGVIFSPRVPEEAERLRLNLDIPRPFVIKPPLDNGEVYERGRTFSFGLILVGKARDFLPYFLVSFRELGERGIGVGRGRFHIARLEAADASRRSETVFEDGDPTVHVSELAVRFSDFSALWKTPPTRLTLRFLTPVLLKQHDRWVRPAFGPLMRRLRDRLQALAYFYCGSPIDMDFEAFGEAADSVRTVHEDLHWIEEDRYSKYRDVKHTLKGYVGSVTFEGELSPFLPFLLMGEYVHVGKAVAFGQGWYQIEGLV